MIKKISAILLSFGILFILVNKGQSVVLGSEIEIRFGTFETNLFFAVSSCIICLALLALESTEKFKPQLGFLYLPTLFLKGIFFYGSFTNSVFALENLSIAERLNLLIPFFIFLALEVYFVAKIINKNPAKI